MDENGSGGGGERNGESIVLALEFDPRTYQVSIGGTPMPLSLAQMICNEGSRVLEEARRLAALQSMQKAAADRARTQGLVNRAFGRH